MKKTILTTLLFALSASVMTAQADVKLSFAEQLMMQKTQLHPQEFNFISDRYKQVQVQKTRANHPPSFLDQLNGQKTQLNPQQFKFISDHYKKLQAQKVNGLSFKAQLDSQKLMAREHKFYPVLGMTYTTTTADVKPTFKVQLDSQKQLLRPQLFIARSDAYYQVTSH